MNNPFQNWKLACASVAEHSAITLKVDAPMVAFSPLALPQAARAYLAKLDIKHISSEAIRARGGLSSYQNIKGWHANPYLSGSAKLELANGFNLTFPDATGKPALIEHMVHLYAGLASAWNRESLIIETRGQHNKKDNAHTDFGAEYVSIANLTNVSTLFAPPDSYRGIRPHTFTAEDGGLRSEYRMSNEMKAALESLPAECLTSWRGTLNPAVHIVPQFEGTRTIILANTLPGSKPALI